MEELYLPTVPVPVHHMEGFYNSASKLPKCRFEAMYRQNRQADDSRENGFSWIGAAVLQCEKVQGWIPLHEMYIFDTQEKSDRRNTNGILLSHGKLKGFQVNGRAWTFQAQSVRSPLKTPSKMTKKTWWTSRETKSWTQKGQANWPMQPNTCLSVFTFS